MSTLYSIGQMNQLADALEAAGYTPGDVTEMRSSVDALKAFLSVLAGTSEIVEVRHIINLDANPFCPDGWKVFEHQRGGQFEWDPAKVEFFLSEKPRAGVTKSRDLREEMKSRQPFNANLLDYLLKNPHLIPKEWEGKSVFFWGTTFRDSYGRLCVPYLCKTGGRWLRCYDWNDNEFWHGNNPAAVRVS